MDQSTIDTHYMTREFLESQIVAFKESIDKKDALIKSLEDRMSAITQRSYADSAERNRIVSEMQEYTLEELENGGLSESQAESIASICGFELTKEFEVEVTVQYSVTVNAKNEEEVNAAFDIYDGESAE